MDMTIAPNFEAVLKPEYALLLLCVFRLEAVLKPEYAQQ